MMLASLNFRFRQPRLTSDELILLLVLFVLSAAFSLLSPFFLTTANISNILQSVSVIGVMAALATLTLIGRELDLSIGSMVAMLGVILALLVETMSAHWALGIGLTVLAGALAGALNGLMVGFVRVNSIITTIGTLSVFRGIAYMLTDGETLSISSDQLLFFGFGRVFGVPLAIWLFVMVVGAAHFVGRYTVPGRMIFAVGANPRAAIVCGLPVSAIRFSLFVASGISAAVGAILLVGQTGLATPGAAVGYELLVVTAVLIGGTSLNGGDGSVLKTAIGVLVIGVLNNGMVLLNVPTFYQISAHGVLMLAAVILDQLRSRRADEIS